MTVTVRPLGSPVALGLSGLVAASLVVSGVELGWVAADERRHAALVLLGFAFLLQFTAALFAFLARDGAVGSALGVLSGTWLCTGLVWLTSAPGSTSAVLGLLLVASAGLLAAAAAAAAAGKLVPAAVFAVESVRFAFAGLHELSGAHVWQDVAGVIGLVVVALAGYAMLALVLEDAHGHTVLPLGRRGPGAEALAAPLARQVGSVEHEAGVREQL